MNLEQISQFQFGEELYRKFDIRQANGELIKEKRELVQLVNESLLRRCARTSKDKFEALDMRDKLLKLIRYEANNLAAQSESTQQVVSNDILIGTCMDMCPEKERYSRETLALYNIYELDQNNEIDHHLMVKEYSRSSADQDLPLSNELRPISVLFETMLYLIDEIIPKIVSADGTTEDEKFPYSDWYDFVWNRTRAIRKDIIQQRLLLNDNEQKLASDNDLIQKGLGGVLIIEQCARFHIMCAHRMCEQSSDVFDFKINEENLKNCFQSLRQYYESSASSQVTNQHQLQASPCEAEFRSYSILLNLNESNILCEIQRWPSHIRNSRHVKFALSVYFSFTSRNYVRFFRLVKSDECEYLQACILHRYFYRVRCEAFKAIFTSFKDQKERSFPLSKLNDLLGFDQNELLEYCDRFDLEINDGNLIMPSSSSFTCFKLTKSNEDSLKAHRSRLVENKFMNESNAAISKEKCLSQIIAGSAVENTTSQFAVDAAYELTSSFNAEGYYCGDEIEQMFEYARQKRAEQASQTLAQSNQPKLNKLAPAKPIKKQIKPALQTKPKPKRTLLIGEPTSETTNKPEPTETAFNNPFTFMTRKTATSQPEAKETNLFSNLISKSQATTNEPPKFPFFVKPTEQPTSSTQSQFELQLRNLDKDDYEQRKQRELNQKSENIFESIYLSVIRDLAGDFVLAHKVVPPQLANEILSQVVEDQVRKMGNEILPLMRQDQRVRLENEKRQRELELKRQQEEEIYFRQLNYILESQFDSILSELTRETCSNYVRVRRELESHLYDEIICDVFQKEFEIVIKQVANEINNELTLDRLAENVYFSESLNNSLDEASTTQAEHLNLNSIFMTDLCSCLHESVYECTRLNLNVNRELYYELKQAIYLNEKKRLFRKWRLKMSVKLLSKAHKRALADQSKHLISFVKSYGLYLVNNLSKLQSLLSFMISNEYSIVHCEQFQMHLTWNLNLNYKHYLYDLVLENYFSVIHNRDDELILSGLNQELCGKTCLVMPKLSNKLNLDIEGVKRWLMNKFFHFDSSNTYSYETSHLDSVNISQNYGLRYCIKICASDMTPHEYELKMSKRSLYGANSMIYVLVPEDNQTFDAYLADNRARFFNILKLFNENLLDLNAYQFMFVSYLGKEHTLQVIKHLLNDATNYVYCLLDGDVVKDNVLVQSHFKQFMFNIYKANQLNKISQINNVLSLSTLVEMTLMKFFEFLNLTVLKKSIYLSFNSLCDEYNQRLEHLIKLLVVEEYKQISWPIPEFLDSEDSLLKYWNTNECFDLIRNQFYDLLYLRPMRDDTNLSESHFFKYLNDVINLKTRNKLLPSRSECVKSAYQMETRIKSSFTKSNWPEIVSAILEYLLTNGYLSFQNKLINLDKFYVYCNLDKLKAYDWVNNCLASTNTSPCSSIVSLDLKPSNYIVRKYELKDNRQMKRRFSDESVDLNESMKSSDTIKSSTSVSPVKQIKFQRLTSSELKSKEFDLKFKQFFDLLNMEKENNRELETRLSKQTTANTSSTSVRETNSDSSPSQNGTKSEDISKTFDQLMLRLSEEKSKNEKFNLKLNQMLDF